MSGARPYTTVTSCRVCGADLAPVLDLGALPLVNRLPLTVAADYERYPLRLARCENAPCSLYQLRDEVAPEKLFAQGYPYYSSSSPTMVAAMKELAEEMLQKARLAAAYGPLGHAKLPEEVSVCEIASNDGYLLQHYKAMGCKVLGVEPADGPRGVALDKGIPTANRFFTGPESVAELNTGAGWDLVHAHNVVAHVPGLVRVLEGVRGLLSPTGQFVMEVPAFEELVRTGSWDTIYHEHVFYFGLRALCFALEKAGLFVVDAELVPLHGGSWRVSSVRSDSPLCEAFVPTPRLVQALVESAPKLEEAPAYLAASVREGRRLKLQLQLLRSESKSIGAYGASAKGCVRLNVLGIDSTLIEFVADKTEAKWGKILPGTGIPIVPAAELEKRQPDVCVLLTWNFEAEIRREQQTYLDKGGRFLVPVSVMGSDP